MQRRLTAGLLTRRRPPPAALAEILQLHGCSGSDASESRHLAVVPRDIIYRREAGVATPMPLYER